MTYLSSGDLDSNLLDSLSEFLRREITTIVDIKELK
jgi:hypothetical protein